MAALLLDRADIKKLLAHRRSLGLDRWDEMWEGVYVVPPDPNDEHQELQFLFLLPLAAVVHEPSLGRVRGSVNVSDRDTNWKENFRCPDVVVFLNTTSAVNRDTHWVGGPDFLVEIISPDEEPRGKLGFYAGVKTREVLIVERDPWAVELHQLRGKKLVLAGRSDLRRPTVLTSAVLPLTFQLVAGEPRPRIEVTHSLSKTWLV